MVWAKGRKLQDGKYIIEKELDQGGFGITYLVKRDDGQRFVVKPAIGVPKVSLK